MDIFLFTYHDKLLTSFVSEIEPKILGNLCDSLKFKCVRWVIMGLTLNANCNVVHEVDNVFRCSRRRRSSRTRATRFSRSPLLQHNCVTSSRTWTSIRGEHDKC